MTAKTLVAGALCAGALIIAGCGDSQKPATANSPAPSAAKAAQDTPEATALSYYNALKEQNFDAVKALVDKSDDADDVWSEVFMCTAKEISREVSKTTDPFVAHVRGPHTFNGEEFAKVEVELGNSDKYLPSIVLKKKDAAWVIVDNRIWDKIKR
jgi:hypothetical protein